MSPCLAAQGSEQPNAQPYTMFTKVPIALVLYFAARLKKAQRRSSSLSLPRLPKGFSLQSIPGHNSSRNVSSPHFTKAKAVPNTKLTWEGDSSWLAPKHVASLPHWEECLLASLNGIM